jgi:hypothetical protein
VLCGNGLDDDCDGDTDCDDALCAFYCCLPEDCDDGIDNDCDGLTNCNDWDCCALAACGGCPTPSPCAGGWLDTVASLCWQDPADSTARNWDEAVAYCTGLSLAGHGPGSWHLPTISELRSLIRGCPETATGGACGVTDGCLNSTSCWSAATCGPLSCPNLSGPGAGGSYLPPGLSAIGWTWWSSSPWDGGATYAWAVWFSQGGLNGTAKWGTRSVRCVRPGP